jgi:hypothetical protein
LTKSKMTVSFTRGQLLSSSSSDLMCLPWLCLHEHVNNSRCFLLST